MDNTVDNSRGDEKPMAKETINGHLLTPHNHLGFIIDKSGALVGILLNETRLWKSGIDTVHRGT